MPRILIVEDNVDLANTISDWLQSEHYDVEQVTDGLEALSRVTHYTYDVIILDWELPGASGIEVLRQFRHDGGKTPVLMLTARRTMLDKETGFDAGSDDYLTKPFEVRELSLRVRALMRRGPGMPSSELRSGDLILDPLSGRATRDGRAVDLRPREFALLEFFMRNPHRIFSIDALLERVWSMSEDATPDGVRSSIKRLRQALNDSEGTLIRTVHRMGYRFEP